MKKLLCFTLITCILLIACGCNRSDEIASTTTPAVSTEPISINSRMAAVSLPAITEAPLVADDGTVLFSYTYQGIAFTLDGQETADQIIIDFLNRVDATRGAAESVAEAAKSAYTGASNWTPYVFRTTYNPTRLDRIVLSLFGNSVTYSGGAHPELTCVSANYNMLTGETLTLGSILAHVDSVEPLCNLVISTLATQAEEKHLRNGYEADIRQRFAGEESYDEAFYFSENGLCFYFAPYEIAPYSSGVIIAEIPYSDLSGIIADEYFPGEKQIITSNMEVNEFNPENASNYNQISELILDPEGEMYILTVDNCAFNIRINVKLPAYNDSYTAYAARFLNPGDGIVIQVNEANIADIQIQYENAGQAVTLHIK